MSFQSLVHQDGKWLAFDGQQVRHLDARPRIERASVVITDFDGAVSQVTAFEGSPGHAVPLIEKRLRADGLIDNESKILVHRTHTVGNGYQALFTAVPLDRWQPMFAWAEAQPDHCLLVPSVALLWRLLKPGRGVVLHSGRQLVFLASLRDRVVYASALAFSLSRDDLTMTVASLGERVGRELADGEHDALESLEVEWLGVLTPAPAPNRGRPADMPAPDADAPAQPLLQGGADNDVTQRHWPRGANAAVTQLLHERHDAVGDDAMTFDGQFDAPLGSPVEEIVEASPTPWRATPAVRSSTPDAWLDDALLEIFAANSGASVRLGAHSVVSDTSGARYRTAIGRLSSGVSAMIAVNPMASRLMYLAERALPWASAASLALAIGLSGLGGRWTLLAHEASEHADGLQNQVVALDEQIAGLQRKQAMPAEYPQLLTFIERAAGLQRALDPHAALATVRDAAAGDVRILRVRLDSDGVLRVDGMVNPDADASRQGMQVARFVERLRVAGYAPEAVDPQTGNSRSQSPGGSFSYQLKRAADAHAEKAS